MKYVSFSLWGDKPIYNVGAIKNSELVGEMYEGWKMIVFHDNTVPKKTLNVLEKNNVQLIDCTNIPYDSFWRFFVSDYKDCEYAIFRDCDSRLSHREYLAVNEWIESGKTLHIMRDHPAHGVPFGASSLGILAGMWGIKGQVVNLRDMINEFTFDKKNYYGIDQSFLQIIYNKFKNDYFVHDEFYEKKPFPIKRENGRFVGERISINETPVTQDYKILL
jgi:hypothetical protein